MSARTGWSVLTLLSGAFLAVQARMNGELAVAFGHGLDAAIWSFGSGLLLLCLLLALVPSMRAGFRSVREALRARSLRWWQCIGGTVGGLYVFTQAYAVPLAGVALFTIAVVGAQTISAVGVDRFGIGPAGRVAVTWPRVAAALLAVVGVVISVGDRIRGASDTSSVVVLPVVLAALAGAAMTVQQGFNGRVTVAAGQPLTTTWLNFAFGSAVLWLIAIPASRGSAFGAPTSLVVAWWAWFGGLLGVGIIAVGAISVRHLGVLLVSLLMLAGQLLAAVLLDLLDASTRGHITPVAILGLLVTLAAALLAGLAARRRPHTADEAGRDHQARVAG
jgi:bacterial/archaeal transporter family-2 protein